MKILIIICRVVLGVGFIFFGGNILHPFMPMPPFQAGSPSDLFMAVMGPHHWMTLIGLFQFFGGVFVLLGRTAPFGLMLLAPVLVNILAFHIFLLGGQGIAPGLIFSIIELFLIYSYRSYFSPIFSIRATPTSK